MSGNWRLKTLDRFLVRPLAKNLDSYKAKIWLGFILWSVDVSCAKEAKPYVCVYLFSDSDITVKFVA